MLWFSGWVSVPIAQHCQQCRWLGSRMSARFNCLLLLRGEFTHKPFVMSRKITFVGLLLFYSQLSIAQYCNDGQPASSAFDWTASSWQVLIRPIFTQIPVLVTVPSPYYPANITSQPNTQHIEAASGMGDCHPDDGWVLAAELMGFDEPVRFPQFVIYNRY